MKPEDIDKLFKERLGHTSPTPPADLWNRLQTRMEAGEEKPVILLTPEAEQKKEGKQRYLWIYSAVAATLSLLLAVGVVFFNINSGTPEISGTITKYDGTLPEQSTVVEPILIPAPEATAKESMMAEAADENLPETEKKLTPQATDEPTPASTLSKKPVKQLTLAKATPKAAPQPGKAKATVQEVTMEDAQPAIAANTTSEAPAVEVAPVTQPAAVASANLNAEPVEIIIKRAVATQTAMPEETEQLGSGNSRKALARNIFKQVRNLASGDGVELEELGIRADRVALETQIGKQKISKVINL
ncbi:hypothetical protein [Pontibacter flavimaris]|uniref:Uncharacterized protein n=1 Tax=Pontibacter flavimaris TaxID=1797110 RepID=A0A1Q5PH23_9BACT|nr:hypothetical protein [Pontibacter flavimaris]OKL41538.1 hypothetical protein A3841_10855 [Pontibacter flavimaris]